MLDKTIVILVSSERTQPESNQGNDPGQARMIVGAWYNSFSVRG